MEIEDAIDAYLLTQSGLTALIGDRLYTDDADGDNPIYPYVVNISISDVLNHTHDGQNALENPIKQYTVYADTKASADAVAAELEAAMKDFSGTLSGLEVSYITLINRFKSKEKTADGTTSVNYIDLEFEIAFIRS